MAFKPTSGTVYVRSETTLAGGVIVKVFCPFARVSERVIVPLFGSLRLPVSVVNPLAATVDANPPPNPPLILLA